MEANTVVAVIGATGIGACLYIASLLCFRKDSCSELEGRIEQLETQVDALKKAYIHQLENAMSSDCPDRIVDHVLEAILREDDKDKTNTPKE